MDSDRLAFEDEGIHIIHTRGEDEILDGVKSTREHLLNDKGFSRGGDLRHVCSIPIWYFENDPKLTLYELYKENKMVPEAKRMLRSFLLDHPQFVISNRNI